MKPFLGIDLSLDKDNEQMNGQQFVVQRTSATLSRCLEVSFNEAEERFEKSQLPLIFRIVQSICGIASLLFFLGILRADCTIKEAYHNAPWVFWALGICGIVWMILSILGHFKSKEVLETDESSQIFRNLDTVTEHIFVELGVPANAKDVDLLMFFYKMKDGNVKVCEKGMQIAPYFNPQFRVYADKEYLYFANVEGKYAFHISSIVNIHTVNKHIRIREWNKEEEYNQGIYKQYKLTADQYDCIHCKTYHILEVEHNGESWGIYVPCYEWHVFEEIHERFRNV